MKKSVFLMVAIAVLALSGCSGKSDGASAPSGSIATDAVGISEIAEDGGGSAQAQEPEEFVRPDGNVVEINERLFIAQTNDIYLNPDDYLGKTIRYEGMYKKRIWEGEDQTEEIHYVIRYGPGCCGYDDEAGFEVDWDGEWPEEDDWVAVDGVLYKVDVAGGGYYLVLSLNSITVQAERGAEYVAM